MITTTRFLERWFFYNENWYTAFMKIRTTVFRSTRRFVLGMALIMLAGAIQNWMDGSAWAFFWLVLGLITLWIYFKVLKEAEPLALQKLADLYHLEVDPVSSSIPAALKSMMMLESLSVDRVYSAHGALEGRSMIVTLINADTRSTAYSIFNRDTNKREDFYVAIQLREMVPGWLVVDQGTRDLKGRTGFRVHMESVELNKKLDVLVSERTLAHQLLDPHAMSILLDWKTLPDIEMRENVLLLRLELYRFGFQAPEAHIANALRLATQLERNIEGQPQG